MPHATPDERRHIIQLRCRGVTAPLMERRVTNDSDKTMSNLVWPRSYAVGRSPKRLDGRPLLEEARFIFGRDGVAGAFWWKIHRDAHAGLDWEPVFLGQGSGGSVILLQRRRSLEKA